MTLNELIDRLTKFRDTYGGDIQVVIQSEYTGAIRMDETDLYVWDNPIEGNLLIISAPTGGDVVN